MWKFFGNAQITLARNFAKISRNVISLPSASNYVNFLWERCLSGSSPYFRSFRLRFVRLVRFEDMASINKPWKLVCEMEKRNGNLKNFQVSPDHSNSALHKKCPYSEFFGSLFSRIWTEYGEILCISPYWVRMRENAWQ